MLTLIAVLGGGAAFAAFERDQDLSAWDGVWWAITTVTTVGYGNPEVTTDGGRIIGICFVRTRRQHERAIEHQLTEILRRLESLERRPWDNAATRL